MPTSGRNWPAPKGRSPKPGRGASTDHGWVAEGSAPELGAEADLAAAGPEHVPGLAGLPAPRTKSVTSRSATLAPGTRRRERGGHGPARDSDPAPDPDLTPGVASGDPCVHSPLWLTQVGFRSFIVRPPPG